MYGSTRVRKLTLLNWALLPGVNTGPCITGDADCEGNASRTGPSLAAFSGASDNHVLDRGEYAVVILNFGVDYTAPFSPPEANPSLAAVGGWVA